MKLPNLSELDLDSNLDKFKDVEEKKSELPKKAKRKLPTVSKDETLSKKESASTESVKGEERKRPKLPKSQYDEDGTPILNVPDLDDVNLMGEIDRFFGEEDD